MCRSIESAILGFSNCLINLLIILKVENNSKIKYFIPFIINLMMVQFSNMILWSQYDGKKDLKKNNINWLATEFVIIILLLQPLIISYMTNSFIDNDNVKSMVYLISAVFFIKGIERNEVFTKKNYTILEKGKCLKWAESSKSGQFLFYLFDILPFLVAIYYINNTEDKKFLGTMLSSLSLVYFIVSKYGIWWGSEWCAYGTAITGYITYYVISNCQKNY